MRLSLLIPTVPATAEQAVPFARYVAHDSQLSRLWQGQSYGLEPAATFAYLAGAGYPVPAGTCVLVTPLRHPAQAALEARTVAAVTGQPAVMGYGPGSRATQTARLGAAYDRPVDAAAEFIRATRSCLAQRWDPPAGGPGQGAERPAGAPGYFHPGEALTPVPHPRVRLGLGVLRPAMARVAGEVADAAITWLAPAGYIRDTVLPAVDKGAESAGRPRPSVVAAVPVAVERRGRHPVELAHLSAGGHLVLPHYADMLARAGVDVPANDPVSAARALISGGGFLYGSPSDIAAGLAGYAAAGVDEVILNLTGVHSWYGTDETLLDLNDILAATVSAHW
ncbi:LLM class flavin-dependent oxidoreductase [Streptomyces hesseae]|uniref:LLM class flavin-dependent oxidoreductase n=1 Tax=Streptomyces hesseae TaxID=3075519 RepID=A0ABU2SWL3_9ACTN|nr:LLM class flavin-dependent oxidoreductase [Streptomyces sp. DSM 40473]MDT0453383.1 LLM class flavin-dependent oxidoreductase [Streptomyces sp. DSM 40473]